MSQEYQNFSSLSLNLNRQKHGPLDISQVFLSREDLDWYRTNGSAEYTPSDYWSNIVPYPYSGQVVAVITANKNKQTESAEFYYLTLKADGTYAANEFSTQGGGTSANSTPITYNTYTVPYNDTRFNGTVNVINSSFGWETDNINVYQCGVLLTRDTHYTLDVDNNITLLNDAVETDIFTIIELVGNAISMLPSIEAGDNVDVTISDDDKLVISAKDTVYSAGDGISIEGNYINNSGVVSISSGKDAGTLAVTAAGSVSQVSVTGFKRITYDTEPVDRLTGTYNDGDIYIQIIED